MAGLLRLTSDERRVAQAILRGESPREICARLNIPASRYKTHIHRMLQKTSSHSQVELVAKLRHSIAHR